MYIFDLIVYNSSMKLVAASKMRGDINRYEAAAPFGEIFTRLSTVPEDFDEPEESKSSKTTMVRRFSLAVFILRLIMQRKCMQPVPSANCQSFVFLLLLLLLFCIQHPN